jgi:hypothetical protein
MKKSNFTVITLLIGFILNTNALAESISKDKYTFLKKNIDTKFGTAIVRCNAPSENASVEYIKIANGNRDVSKAKLHNVYTPEAKIITNTSKADGVQKERHCELNRAALENEHSKVDLESVVTKVSPIEPMLIPAWKDIFTSQNKSITM